MLGYEVSKNVAGLTIAKPIPILENLIINYNDFVIFNNIQNWKKNNFALILFEKPKPLSQYENAQGYPCNRG